MTTVQERQTSAWWLDVLVRVCVALALLALLTHFVARPFVIPSGSMDPALVPGDRVVVRVAGVDADDLDRGTVIAFSHGETWQEERIEDPNPITDLLRYSGDLLGVGPSHHAHTVKRIIGLPGETISCCGFDGMIRIDDRPLAEPYVEHDLEFERGTACDRPVNGAAPSTRCFPEVTVPDDSYLVLGDNRAGSSDSVEACRGRAAGQECDARFVPADQIVGVVAWRWWPLPPGDAVRTP